jgi:hypothetical protein
MRYVGEHEQQNQSEALPDDGLREATRECAVWLLDHFVTKRA